MILNLNDPDSIIQWWSSFPERHWGFLAFYEERSPDFRAAIRAAQRRIRQHPAFDPAFEAPAVRAPWPALPDPVVGAEAPVWQ